MGSPVSEPKVNIQLLPAAIVDAFADRRDLVVVQNKGGSAADKELITDAHTLGRNDLIARIGAGHGYYCVQSLLASSGSFSELDILAVDPSGAGAAATATVTFSGAATAAGTLRFAFVDERLFTVNISVAIGDTATALGDKLVAAVTALARPLVTAANASGVVTVTAADVGTIGNAYGLKTSGVVAGVSVALAGFSGGANDPTLTDALDGLEGRRYTGLLWPENWNSALTVPTDFMDARFNAGNAILDGVVFHGSQATFASNSAKVQPLNSQSLVIGGNDLVDTATSKGPAILQPADFALAYFMGVRSRRLTPGAPVADFIVSTSGRLDAFGGPALASLPYFNTPLDRTPVTLPAEQYSAVEQAELEQRGLTVYGVNIANNAMIMGPVVTTWTTDAAGNENPSFKYLNYVDTGSSCREIFWRTLRATFAQSRLTEGDLIADRSIANDASIKAECLRIYRILAGQALVQAGEEAEEFFNENTNVTINLATRSASIAGPLAIVTQLGVINYALQLTFTVGETGTQVVF
ncbi:MAG: hypothetical protein AAF360_02150 [Pseudomonadota bacterium]